MRFGCLFLLALVPLLAFPAVGAAERAPLTVKEAEPETMLAEVEHISLTVTAPDEGQAEGPPGRPGVVRIALRYLGTPYRWSGASPSGFDCSGFVIYVYKRVGIALPHNGAMLWRTGRAVPRDALAPGDVVFFDGLGHVGIYIGGDRFVHSPHSGDVVKISRLSESWYRSTYVGARRY